MYAHSGTTEDTCVSSPVHSDTSSVRSRRWGPFVPGDLRTGQGVPPKFGFSRLCRTSQVPRVTDVRLPKPLRPDGPFDPLPSTPPGLLSPGRVSPLDTVSVQSVHRPLLHPFSRSPDSVDRTPHVCRETSGSSPELKYNFGCTELHTSMFYSSLSFTLSFVLSILSRGSWGLTDPGSHQGLPV